MRLLGEVQLRVCCVQAAAGMQDYFTNSWNVPRIKTPTKFSRAGNRTRSSHLRCEYSNHSPTGEDSRRNFGGTYIQQNLTIIVYIRSHFFATSALMYTFKMYYQLK